MAKSNLNKIMMVLFLSWGAILYSQTIEITSPNGGEVWLIGSTHDITWTTSGEVGNVKIEYSGDNGSNWVEISASTENDGIYSWTVPVISSINCLVRASETDGDLNDVGNAVFTISEGISGRVTDESGNGIANVHIKVYNFGQDYFGYYSTDINGFYEVSGISARNYKLFFDTYDAGNYIHEWYNDKVSFDTADPVTVTGGQTTSNIDAQLAPGGIISGRVTDNSGNGIQGIYVYIYDLSESYIPSSYTNSEGYYSFVGLPGGSYKICFRDYQQNYISEWYNDKISFDTADPVIVISGQTTPNIDAQLAPGGIISGRVTDNSGNGIQGIGVYISNSSESYISSNYTNSEGNYSVGGLPGGSYKIHFSAYQQNYIPEWYNDKVSFDTADPVTVISGQTTPNIDAQLSVGGIISGRVTDSLNNSIQGINVKIYDLNHTLIVSTSTDSAGNYSIGGIPGGSFKVYYYSDNYGQNYFPQWYNDKLSFDAADPVAVTVGQTTPNIDAQLSIGGIISGRVTDNSDNGIQGIDVDIYDLTYSLIVRTATDSAGNYLAREIPNGSYKVYFNVSQLNYVSEWYNDKFFFEIADPVVVIDGQITPNIDAQLTQGGAISGRVMNQSGRAIANVGLYVYDANHTIQGNSNTDANGYYTVLGLNSGNYRVYFRCPVSMNYIPEWYNDKPSFETANPVAVTVGQTTSSINAELAVGGIISGRVTDNSSNGIEGIEVNIYDLAHSSIAQASTDRAGNYSVGGLPAGSYKVYFNVSQQYYISEWYNDKSSFESSNSVAVTIGETTVNINAQLAPGGMISGRITDASTGAGIQGIDIRTYDVNGNNVNTFGCSDEDGNYTIKDLPNGNFKINFDAYYYNQSSAVKYIIQWYNDKNSFQTADIVAVTAGQTTSGINAALFTIFSNPAGWEPLEDMQNNMIVNGTAYNNINRASIGDWIGAFGPGGVSDCRAVAQIGADGNYYLKVRSNTLSGETINFKLFPLPSGPSIDSSESIQFISNYNYAGLPLHFGPRTQDIPMVKGWNWIAFNVHPADISLNSVFVNLLGIVEQVKCQTQAVIYSGGNWIGDLTDMSGIANGVMYKVNTAQPCTLSVNGLTISFNKSLPLVSGWNWTAYLPTLSLPVESAIGSIFSLLNQVKSQSQAAVKVGDGLIGDLTQMESNKGYTIKMADPGLLVYPHGASVSPDRAGETLTDANPDAQVIPWKTIQGNQYNMVAYGKVFLEGLAINTSGYYLASLGLNGEGDCRSVSSIGTDGSYFSAILGNTNGETVKFKLYNSSTHKTYDIVETLVFQSDDLIADSNFRARSIRVNAPAGDEQYDMGAICIITWEAYQVSNVKIELYKNSKSLSVIAASVPANSHSFSWTIPARMRSGNNYQIKISAVDAGVMTEDTTANFTILPTAALSLNYPVGTEVWQVKRSYDITWGSSGIDNI
ncbi:MAG: carboxypeptidase regulatory-like domain-containing protein, partial [Candidatus Aminicenantes bacterium]|nr:carboxypeptidase regulatory-like domain-containing protein [Candidatus Aminicenantes bacterium]